MHIPRVVTEVEYRAALAEIRRLVERERNRGRFPGGAVALGAAA